MKDIKVSKLQSIVNLVRSKKDGTIFLTNNHERYLVSSKTIFKGSKKDIPTNLHQFLSSYIEDVSFEFIGTWYDEEEDLFYIDLGYTYFSKNIALKIAKILKEKAIYDIEEKEVIYIN